MPSLHRYKKTIVAPTVTRITCKSVQFTWSWMEQLTWASVSGSLGSVPSILWVGEVCLKTFWLSVNCVLMWQRNSNLWWLNPAFPVTHYTIKGLFAGSLFKVWNFLCKANSELEKIQCWFYTCFHLSSKSGVAMETKQKSKSLWHSTNLFRAP